MRTPILAALFLGLTCVSSLFGQTARFASYDELRDAFVAQNKELEEIRGRLNQMQPASAAANGETVPSAALGSGTAAPCAGVCGGQCASSCGLTGPCETCCGDCCGPTCAGWVGGVELVFLKFYSADGVASPQGRPASFGLESSPRFWVGRVFCDGLGMRARYWDYDHSITTISADRCFSDRLRIDTDVFDLEVTDTVCLGGRWEATLSGGYRHVDFSQEASVQNVQARFLFASAIARSSGDGVTMALELRRPIRCSALSLFGNVRGSWLYGNESMYFTAGDGAREVVSRVGITDKDFAIWETQLGLDWSRPMCNGSDLFLRFGGEFQRWDNFARGGSVNAISSGFAGLFFGVGFVR